MRTATAVWYLWCLLLPRLEQRRGWQVCTHCIAHCRPQGRHEVAEPSWITVCCALSISQRSSGHFYFQCPNIFQGSRRRCLRPSVLKHAHGWVGTCHMCQSATVAWPFENTHCQLLPIESIPSRYILAADHKSSQSVPRRCGIRSIKLSTKFRGNLLNIWRRHLPNFEARTISVAWNYGS